MSAFRALLEIVSRIGRQQVGKLQRLPNLGEDMLAQDSRWRHKNQRTSLRPGMFGKGIGQLRLTPPRTDRVSHHDITMA